MVSPVCLRVGSRAVAACFAVSLAAPAFAFYGETYDANAVQAAPSTYAITNARIVPGGTSAVIERGTLVIRGGKIVAVGANVSVPKDAQTIDGTGLSVYPAFADAFTTVGMPLAADYPKNDRGNPYPVGTVRADIEAASMIKADAGWAARRKNGFASALVAPGVGLVAGTSSWVSLAAPAPNAAQTVLSPNVAMHASWDNPKPVGASEYPESLMGEIAAIRQALYDAIDADKQTASGKPHPVFASAVLALVPVVKRQKPLVLHADSAVSIRRVLRLCSEFQITPIIEGGAEAGAVAGELKAVGASVLLSTAFPEPAKIAEGEPDNTPLQTFRYRATVPRTAGKLAEAGVPFAFSTEGLKSVDDYRKNVRKMIASGLSESAATSAATGAATLLGVKNAGGTLTPGSVADLQITTGDLWNAKTRVRYLFVDGVQSGDIEADAKPTATKTATPGESDADYAQKAYDEAIKLLPSGVSVEQAIAFLKNSPDQATPFLPPGKSVDDVLAALEKRATKPDDGKTPASKEPETVTAPPVVGDGMVPPLPPPVAASFVLRGATVWTVAKDGILPVADVYVKDGKIAGVGANLQVPGGTLEIPATGKHVSPGMIDCHSHTALDAVNEGTNSVTAECRIADVIDPEDVNIYRQLAGGTTCANLLHGSANPIGGQNQIVKWRWGQNVEGMVFAGAPAGIKFALGENVTQSNYDAPTPRYPYSRMGVEKTIRQAFVLARDYQAGRKDGTITRRDLRLDALAEVLDGKRKVHCHSYRADEILMMIRVADEFGFQIGTFQHVLEGYKVADEIAKHGAGGSTFSDWWAYKFEVRDAIPYNGALMNERGVVVSFNSDDSELARRMNLEAAKAVHFGNLAPAEAIKFVTINPAKQLGIDKFVGSIETGKDADLVVWSGDPLSTATICEKTFVDGKLLFDRAADIAARPVLAAEKKRLADAEKPAKKSAPKPTPAPPKEIGTGVTRTFTANALAQNAASPVTGTVTALVGATVHPVSGADIPNGVVVMQGDKITAVGAKGAVVIPDGATVTDATGLHIYPGLFDADTQLGIQEIGALRQTVDSRELGDFNPELRAVVAVYPDTDLLPEARANGVLTVITAPEGGTISGQGTVLKLSGWTWEEMAVDPSVGMYITFPRLGGGRFREESDVCEDMAGATVTTPSVFAQAAPVPETGTMDERTAKALKPLNDFVDAAKRYQLAKNAGTVTRTDTKWEAMLPVLSGAKPVYIRANREAEIRGAVTWAKAKGLRMILVGGSEADKCADLLARESVPVILQTVFALPRQQDAPYDDVFTVPAKLAKAGVSFCLTTDENAAIRRLPWTAAMAASFGLDKDAALRAITLAPAQITGQGAHLGSLEVGKDATLIVTTGSPLEITTVVKSAYIRGEAIDLSTRQKKLYERYQSRPRK